MKYKIILLVVFVFLFQLYIAERVIYHDDVVFAGFAKERLFFDTEINAHPVLPVWFDVLFTEMFGVSNRTLRLTSIFFTAAAILLVYFIAYRRDEKTAFLAACIVGLSAWHIRSSQMNSGSDGGIFTFFFLLTLFFFLELQNNLDNLRYILATGVSLGFAFLSKETAFLIFPIIIIIMIIKKYPWKLMVKYTVLITISALLIFSIFPITDYMYNNGETFTAIIHRIEKVATGIPSIYNLLFIQFFSIFKILIWIGPFFLCLAASEIWYKKTKIIEDPMFIYLCVIVSFYSLCIPATLDKTRYLMIIIPVLGIYSAECIMRKIQELHLLKKDFIIPAISTLLFFIFFLILNSTINIASYESNDNPLTLLKQGHTSFSIPVFTETDNSGFLLNFQIIGLAYLLTGCCLGVILFFKNNPILCKYCFFLILAIGIAYNFVVLEEYAFHLTSPNYSNAIKELIAYGQEHNIKQPLYILKNYELVYYLGDNYTAFVTTYGLSDTDPAKIAQFQQELKDNGGTIMFTDMPPIARDGNLWQTINSCKKDLTISDKGIEIGYVFTC